MNDSNPINDPTNLAEPHDRLIDRALAEVVGNEIPPNLAEHILAAAAIQPASAARQSAHSRRWAWAIAASLAIAGTIAWSQMGTLPNFVAQGDGRLKSQTNQSSATTKNKSLMKQQLNGAASAPKSVDEQNSIGLAAVVNEPREMGVAGESGKEVRDFDGPAPVASVPPSPPVGGLSLVQSQTQSTTPEVPPSETQLLARSAQDNVSLGYRWTRDSNSLDITPEHVAGERVRYYGLARRLGDDVEFRPDFYAGYPVVILTDGNGFRPPGDQYTQIDENPFVKAIGGDAVSTFSIDVDTASYANVRQFLMDMRQLPPPDAVRIEELINYFHYDYAPPSPTPPAPGSAGGSLPVDAASNATATSPPPPFAAHVEVAACPWAPGHRLVRIGIKGREIAREKRPPSNLVFLVDVSGSMDEPAKLPLVVDGLRQLTRELGENDRVAIVVYASTEGLALESTRGDKQAAILAALDHLKAGGSTAGGAGIQLAYQIAEDHFIPGGTNRVILCTDGDFNVGVTDTAELERLVAQKAKDTKVFLSILGFGRGNLNDAMMQTIADRGNGNHHYVDNLREARKVLVEEMAGTLITIAKDVKIQVEFNPAQVAGYRLLGYENRMLRTEDFNDDTKDAGEIGAGHTVTALYEVIPAGQPIGVPPVDALKYQPAHRPAGWLGSSLGEPPVPSPTPSTAGGSTNSGAESTPPNVASPSSELLTLKMRYKDPEGDTSRKLEWPVTDAGGSLSEASSDFRFAAAVASFGLLLRDSAYRGNASLDATAKLAEGNLGSDAGGYRTEFLDLVRRAKELRPQQ